MEQPEAIRALAREAQGLTDKDREEVLRFAQFLKSYGRSRHAATNGDTVGYCHMAHLIAEIDPDVGKRERWFVDFGSRIWGGCADTCTTSRGESQGASARHRAPSGGREGAMAQEHRAPGLDEHAIVLRGADDQLAALERLWAVGETADPQADEEAWQTVRRALDASRRAEGARRLFEDQ